jgi:hypothetical protein
MVHDQELQVNGRKQRNGTGGACGDLKGRLHLDCLRASDGELVWRFRAAPQERRVVVRGQLASAWAVHGSVLALGGEVIVAAGRSSYLDGGIHVCRLEPAAGRLVPDESLVDSRLAAAGRQRSHHHILFVFFVFKNGRSPTDSQFAIRLSRFHISAP